MTYEIKIKPTGEYRREIAEQNGSVLPAVVILQVDLEKLTVEQRSLILKAGTPVSGSQVDATGFYVDGETVDALIECIEKREAQKDQAKIEAEAAAAKKEVENIEAAKKYVSGKDVSIWDWTQGYSLRQKFPETWANIEAETARREAEKTAKVEAEKAAQAAKVEALKVWALKSGSAHVKDLIEEGFNWQSIAEAEWVTANTPEGFSNIADLEFFDESYSLKNPTANEITVLRETREKYPTAQLVRAKFADCGETWHKDFVSITLTSPLGNEVEVEKFIENYDND